MANELLTAKIAAMGPKASGPAEVETTSQTVTSTSSSYGLARVRARGGLRSPAGIAPQINAIAGDTRRDGPKARRRSLARS